MAVFVTALIGALFINAAVAFGIAFYWQAKVILKLRRAADWSNALVPWKTLADQNSPQNRFGRFMAGEIFPELRRKWLRAIAYVVLSYLVLFLIAGLMKFFFPEYVL